MSNLEHFFGPIQPGSTETTLCEQTDGAAGSAAQVKNAFRSVAKSFHELKSVINHPDREATSGCSFIILRKSAVWSVFCAHPVTRYFPAFYNLAVNRS